MTLNRKSVKIAVEVNDAAMRTVNNVYVGTVMVTLFFTSANFNNTLPSAVSNLIDGTNNALRIIPIYSSRCNIMCMLKCVSAQETDLRKTGNNGNLRRSVSLGTPVEYSPVTQQFSL